MQLKLDNTLHEHHAIALAWNKSWYSI